MAWGAAALAGADDWIVKRLQKEKMLADAMQQQHENVYRDRALAQQGEIAGSRLDLDRDRLTQDQEEFTAGAPERDARVGHLRVQTRDLEQKPLYAERDRQAEEAAAATAHTNRLAEIGAQGAEQRKTKTTPDAPAAGGGGTGSSGPYAAERNFRTRQSVRQLGDRVNRWTSGVGSVLSHIPETDARDFAADLNTLKANIAFGELAAMRNASKTGGALGAVSDRELALLESALGALDQGQSPASLKRNLQQIDDSLARWEKAQAGPSMGPGATATVNYDNLAGGGPADNDPLGLRKKP